MDSYVQIENARLNNMITLGIQIPESYRSLPFMPMILQPIVENSIKHGYSYQPLTVSISLTTTEHDYLFMVTDNGKGMDTYTKEKLTRNAGSGIGLANINYRLQKYCNTSLHIESLLGEGATMTFLIPKEVSHHECSNCR